MNEQSPPTQSVAVLSGGPTDEHPISIRTGHAAKNALSGLGYSIVDIQIQRNGTWCFDGGMPWTAAEGIAALERAEVAGAFLALHGPFGEDGTVQGILETLGVGYQGSGVRASAMAMNKSISKAIFASQGIPVPAEVRVGREESLDEACARVQSALDFPVFIKPAHLGSSVGACRGTDLAGLRKGIARGLEVDSEVLVEPLLVGQELTCGVLINPETGGVEALPSILIEPVGHDFFDFESKYTPGHNREVCPAPIPSSLETTLRQLALRCHHALGCRDISRTDFIVTANGPMVLEINTLPGLTEASLIPQSAAVAGLPFESLVERLMQAAIHRTRRSSRS